MVAELQNQCLDPTRSAPSVLSNACGRAAQARR
jgi:hypothetical protein